MKAMEVPDTLLAAHVLGYRKRPAVMSPSCLDSQRLQGKVVGAEDPSCTLTSLRCQWGSAPEPSCSIQIFDRGPRSSEVKENLSTAPRWCPDSACRAPQQRFASGVEDP